MKNQYLRRKIESVKIFTQLFFKFLQLTCQIVKERVLVNTD